MNSNRPGWATTICSGCKGGAMNKLPINTSNTAICRHSNSPSQKNRLQRVRASSCLNLWKTSSFLYHYFMSVDFHIGVPLRRGTPELESSLPNKKRDISEWQDGTVEHRATVRECEEQNFRETHCKVPLFVLHGSNTGKASSGYTLSKGQLHHKPLPIKASSGFPLMGSLPLSTSSNAELRTRVSFRVRVLCTGRGMLGHSLIGGCKSLLSSPGWSHLEGCWAKGDSESLSWHLR